MNYATNHFVTSKHHFSISYKNYMNILYDDASSPLFWNREHFAALKKKNGTQ